MMEFEEMQKIWNEQKGETMYAINEDELQRIVTRNKNASSRRINRAEKVTSVVNGLLAIALFILGASGHPLLFYMAGLMVATVAYVQYFRWKRKKAEATFDRSMMGELNHGISNANHIISFNYFSLVYVSVVVATTMSQMIIRKDSWEEWVVITVAFFMGFFMIRREQKASNLPKRKELLTLKKMLTEE